MSNFRLRKMRVKLQQQSPRLELKMRPRLRDKSVLRLL